jgi:hypothetical protein
VEVVERRVVVQLEPVGALGQRLAVELLAVEPQVDREVVVDLGSQEGEVVLRDAVGRWRIGLANPEDVVARAGKAHHVDVAAGVLAEGRGGDDVQPRIRVVLRVRDLEHVRPERRRAVVAVDVAPEKGLHLLVAHDVATRDRAPGMQPARVWVLGDWIDRVDRWRVASRVEVPALEAVPAEIHSASPADIDRPIVDLLP